MVGNIQTTFYIVPAFWENKSSRIMMCCVTLLPFSSVRIQFFFQGNPSKIHYVYSKYPDRLFWSGIPLPLCPHCIQRIPLGKCCVCFFLWCCLVTVAIVSCWFFCTSFSFPLASAGTMCLVLVHQREALVQSVLWALLRTVVSLPISASLVLHLHQWQKSKIFKVPEDATIILLKEDIGDFTVNKMLLFLWAWNISEEKKKLVIYHRTFTNKSEKMLLLLHPNMRHRMK